MRTTKNDQHYDEKHETAPAGYQRRHDPRSRTSYYVHRAVAAWKLGRPLAPGEVVHHINDDPRDNHPNNLLVMSSQAAHMTLHWYDRRRKSGLQALFSIEDILAARGERIVR